MKNLAPHPLQALLYHKDQHRGGDDGCNIHFLSSLGLTNAHKGGIIGVDCEVIVVKIWPLLSFVVGIGDNFENVFEDHGNFMWTMFFLGIIAGIILHYICRFLFKKIAKKFYKDFFEDSENTEDSNQ